MSEIPVPAAAAQPSGLPAGVKPSRREQAQQKAAAGDKLRDTPQETALDKTRDLIGVPKVSPPVSDNAGDSDESLPQSKAGADDQGRDLSTDQAIGLKDLASRLEMKPADLYAVQVPTGTGDGETKSLGELKDFYRNHSQNLERLENLDRYEVQSRTDRMTNIRDLDKIVSYLPPQALNPDFHKEVERQTAELARQETQKLLQVYPEWAEPVTFHAAQTAMRETISEYGFTGDELLSITDHRWLIAISDLAKLKGLQKSASALKPESKSGSSRPATTNPLTALQVRAAATKRAAKSGNKQAQSEAVRNLLFKGN